MGRNDAVAVRSTRSNRSGVVGEAVEEAEARGGLVVIEGDTPGRDIDTWTHRQVETWRHRDIDI